MAFLELFFASDPIPPTHGSHESTTKFTKKICNEHKKVNIFLFKLCNYIGEKKEQAEERQLSKEENSELNKCVLCVLCCVPGRL